MTMPARIVDAHHHLWDLSHCHYPWLMERGVQRFFGDPAPILKDYLATDFISDHGDLPIVKSIHVQVGVSDKDAVNETHWLQDSADKHDIPSAIIAFSDLTAIDLERQLDAHGKASHFRGVRQIVGRSAEEDAKTGTSALLSHPAFADGLRRLAERKLSFDLQLTPPRMQEAADRFCAIPETPVALCHCGSLSDFSDEGLSFWKAGLKRMAEHENILCKISGFGMFDHHWTANSISDHVLSVIDIFGPDRIAFGSNFPVDSLYASYADTMGAYLTITEHFSDTERDAMFYDNAVDFYRI